MIRLKYPVIVEGKYDKIRLSSFIESPIFTTDGFGLFKNKEKRQLIRSLCERDAVILLTDSDKGGELIRRGVKRIAPASRLIHVYIPKIQGKERRKSAPSKEGFLGVEGMSEEILREIFERSGVETDAPPKPPFLTRGRLYADGLMGGEGSAQMRKRLSEALRIPLELSTTSFVDAVNLLCDEESYTAALQAIQNGA